MHKRNSIILYGAGYLGMQALDFYGYRNVNCFVDTYKSEITLRNKKVITFDELLSIYKDFEIIVAAGVANSNEIIVKLKANSIPYHLYREDYCEYVIKHCPPNERIKKWKNVYKGKKCFLLGNGPSLAVSDLEKLHQKQAISFGCNFINKVYAKTDWRPDFYCCSDSSVILKNIDYIMHKDTKAKFINNLRHMKEADYLNESMQDNLCLFWGGGPTGECSTDLSKIVFAGPTVMFSMIQFAVYMGFSQIYLLGVDNTHHLPTHDPNSFEAKRHFYEEDDGELGGIKNQDYWELHEKRLIEYYDIAKAYAEKNGIKIMNATRGGKLEVFERVDFDEVMENWSIEG